MTRDDIIRMAREAGSIDSEGVIETVYRAFTSAKREKDTALLRQALALCSKDGGWTMEEAADTICEIENILLARLEGNHLRDVTKMMETVR